MLASRLRHRAPRRIAAGLSAALFLLGGSEHWFGLDPCPHHDAAFRVLGATDPGSTGHSDSRGNEALGSASISVGERHRIDPLVSLTLNRFHFDGDPTYGDNSLPAAPDVAARGEIVYRRAGGTYFGPTFDYVGDRYADFTNTYVVDGHVLTGLRAGWSTERWELFGEVRNLFDEDYTATVRVYNVAAANARALYPGSPRAVYLGVRFAY